jgi:hypothetical protein
MRIFGPKKEEVAGGWRRLHDEELQNLYPLPNIIAVIKSRRVSWEGHVACMGAVIKRTTLVGKPVGKKPFGRSKRRW